MRLKVGIIGTVIKDRIHSMSGEVTDALGGILYTLLPLRAFLPEEYTIIPILHVGKDLHEHIIELFESLPNVSTVNTIRDDVENNKVDLYYDSEEERTEFSTQGVSPFRFEEIQGLDTIDCLIVNFISGWEISLHTMEKLARYRPGKVFSDIHSLLLGRRRDGKRYPEKPPGLKRWLKCFNYMQMNETEAWTLTGVEIAANGEESMHRLVKAAATIQTHGPGIVAITLGASGAFCSWKETEGKQSHELQSGYRVGMPVDPTGSGDVFLAAFTAASLMGKTCGEALSFAVRASALSTTIKGASGLHRYYRGTGLRP